MGRVVGRRVGAHAVVASATTDVANEGRRGEKKKKRKTDGGWKGACHTLPRPPLVPRN